MIRALISGELVAAPQERTGTDISLVDNSAGICGGVHLWR